MASTTPTIPAAEPRSSPCKRPRLGDDVAEDFSGSPARIEPLTKDGEYWFQDGSVVLAVERHGFRVHQGVLSINSAFFAELFSIPQPKNQETVDGCPVVHMQDSLDEIRHLLRIVYKPRKYVLCL